MGSKSPSVGSVIPMRDTGIAAISQVALGSKSPSVRSVISMRDTGTTRINQVALGSCCNEGTCIRFV